MSAKYLIFGATGSIGSNLANKLYSSNHEFHLVSRNKEELKSLSEKLKCTYTVADVLEDNFIENVKTEISEVKGIAYCVGSIDLKPFKMVKEDDFQKCMKLNLYSAVEIIKAYQDSLKNNKGSDKYLHAGSLSLAANKSLPVPFKISLLESNASLMTLRKSIG